MDIAGIFFPLASARAGMGAVCGIKIDRGTFGVLGTLNLPHVDGSDDQITKP